MSSACFGDHPVRCTLLLFSPHLFVCNRSPFPLSDLPMGRLSARDKRLQIQTLLKTNSSVEEICRLSGASRDTVWRVRTGRVGVSRKRGSGRPRKHCAAVDQSVLRYLKAQRVGSVRRAAVGLRAKGVADLSKSTIHRIAKRFDWHSSRPRKRAKLTPKQKTDRLAFAQRLLAEHPEADKWWQSIVFSDEKSWQLNGCSARLWRRPGVAPPPQLHGMFTGNYFDRSFCCDIM